MKSRRECEKILGKSLVTRVETRLKMKKINQMTIDRVLDYLALHQEAFPFFDIDALSDNLCESLKESITFHNISTSVKYLFKEHAYGFATNGKVFINTKPLKLVLPSDKYNVMVDSLIRHELDHVATTRVMKLDKPTFKKIVARNIRANKELFGEEVVPEGERLEDYINKVATTQFACVIIENGKKTPVQADRIILTRCGVRGSHGDNKVFHFMGSMPLNEGITAYKMKIMDKFAGQGGLMCQSGYILGEEVAGHIARTIGKEEFIARQIAGDFVGIAERYKEITGKTPKQMRRLFHILDTKGYKSFLDKLLTQMDYSNKNQMNKKTQEEYDEIVGPVR